MSSHAPFKEQKHFKKVSSIESKRCYVISQLIRKMDHKKRYLPELSSEEFYERLLKAKKIVSSLNEKELDKRIKNEYPKRLKAYDSVVWYLGEVYTDEVGVWRGAGGLPLEWTHGSLDKTVQKVKQALQDPKNKLLAARAKRSIPRMAKHLDVITTEPYLFPIILPPASEGRGRKGKPYKGFRLMKGDIDDGCMRSITMAISGKKKFKAYVGFAP